jgi:hypothetical protein
MLILFRSGGRNEMWTHAADLTALELVTTNTSSSQERKL